MGGCRKNNETKIRKTSVKQCSAENKFQRVLLFTESDRGRQYEQQTRKKKKKTGYDAFLEKSGADFVKRKVVGSLKSVMVCKAYFKIKSTDENKGERGLEVK